MNGLVEEVGYLLDAPASNHHQLWMKCSRLRHHCKGSIGSSPLKTRMFPKNIIVKKSSLIYFQRKKLFLIF
jgi:hypothetical protein